MQRRSFLKTSAMAGSAFLFSRKLSSATTASDDALIEIMLDEPLGTISPLIYSHQSWLPKYGVDLKLIASGPNQDDVDWTTRFFENIFTAERRIKPPFGWSMHYYTDLPEALKFTAEDVYPGYALADRMEKIMLDHWTAMGVYDRNHRVKLVIDEYGPWYRFSDTRLDPTHVLGQQLTVRDAVMTALTLDTF